MSALVWVIQHADAVFWVMLTLITGAWCAALIRRELITPRPYTPRHRYPRRP